MIFYRSLTDIRAISFDLDDTLYDNHPYIMRAEKRLREFMSETFPASQSLSSQNWLSIKRQLLRDNPGLYSDMGRLRWLTLETGLNTAGYQGAELADATQACFDHFYFERSNFKVPETVVSVLSELRHRVPLVAITNGNVNLEQIGLGNSFDLCLHASLDNPMKPHRHMFDKACAFLQTPAEHILHVGDNLEKDVMGARHAGFRTAWYAVNRTMHLRQEPASVLPDVQLENLQQLTHLI